MAYQPPGGWHFININEPKKQKKDKSIRKIIRANAMRDFRRKQRDERQALAEAHPQVQECEGHTDRCYNGAMESLGPPEMAADQQPFLPEFMPDFLRDERLSNEAYNLCGGELGELLGDLQSMTLMELIKKKEDEVERQAQYNVPDESFATGQPIVQPGKLPCMEVVKRNLKAEPATLLDYAGDPFSALPISDNKSKHYSYVIHHFVTVMATNALPFNAVASENPLTKIWLPHAIFDIAVFSATITFAAVHLDIMSGRSENLSLISHKSETIKRINEKIQNPESALSDSSIGAVAMMAASEIISGNSAELHIHMNALTRMVRLRGGLQQLGWAGVLHMFISWQDLLYSTIMAQPPIYSLAPCGVKLGEHTPPQEPVFSLEVFDPEIARQFGILLADLRYLTDHVNRAQQNMYRRSATSTVDSMTFSKVRTIVEHRILAMARSPSHKPREMMTLDDYTLDLCRLAALVYIKCGLHMYLPICTIILVLKEQLIQLVRDAEMYCAVDICGDGQPWYATWAMFMGSLVATTPEEEAFFAERIAKGTRNSNCRTWSDMETSLKSIAWLDKLCTPACKRVWNQVEMINALEF